MISWLWLCFALHRRTWLDLGGFDPGFVSPGGGLANLDFFKRVCQREDVPPGCLLGEGTFHQVHGGIAANAAPEQHPIAGFQEEYRRIRGEEWQMDPNLAPYYLGRMPQQAREFVMVDPPGAEGKR